MVTPLQIPIMYIVHNNNNIIYAGKTNSVKLSPSAGHLHTRCIHYAYKIL